MKSSYDYEAAKKLIDDETNVTESNPLKDLFKICTQLVLILVIIYFSVFALSGIAISLLSPEKQVVLENILASSIRFEKKNKIETSARAQKVRDDIIKIDSSFPKTSNSKIRIFENEDLNAFCLPNGNIYITSALYKRLTDDEMLTFVIAHEMAHYKHRDHLMQLRKSISTSSVILFMSVVSPNESKQNANIIDDVVSFSDLKNSRRAESSADKYAKNILLAKYGRVDGGMKVLDVLEADSTLAPEFLSTHPKTANRKKRLSKAH